MSNGNKSLYRYTLISGVVLGLLATGGYKASANQEKVMSNRVHVNTMANPISSPLQTEMPKQQDTIVSPAIKARYAHILNGMNYYYGKISSNNQKETKDVSLSRSYIKKYLYPRFNKFDSKNTAIHGKQRKQTKPKAKQISLARLINSFGDNKSNQKNQQRTSQSKKVISTNKQTRSGADSTHQKTEASSVIAKRKAAYQMAALAAKSQGEPLVDSNNQQPVVTNKRDDSDDDNDSSDGNDWFRDGLSDDELAARNWITLRESGNRWNIPSYGGWCIGYFQLRPSYLGYVNGRVNLDPQHQVQVADKYVQSRYGDWVAAQSFWQAHRWY